MLKKKLIFLTTIACIFIALLSPASAQQQSKKAIFIIADGIPADVIEKLSLPHLQTIAKEGAYKRALDEAGESTLTCNHCQKKFRAE